MLDFFWFPTCSHQVSNGFPIYSTSSYVFPSMFLTLSHVLCPKFYSCNLYNQPKGGDYNTCFFGTVQSLDGPIKDAHHKRKEFELWGSRNKWIRKSYVARKNYHWLWPLWIMFSLVLQCFIFSRWPNMRKKSKIEMANLSLKCGLLLS